MIAEALAKSFTENSKEAGKMVLLVEKEEMVAVLKDGMELHYLLVAPVEQLELVVFQEQTE